jgi:hypothetical protein
LLTALFASSISSPHEAGSCQKRRGMSNITNGKVTEKKRLNRVGATPLFGGPSAQKFRGVTPTLTFAEKRTARQRGIGMLLAIQKSYELLVNYGFFVRGICDTCGIVLGAVRFTRHNDSKVYCSRECRSDAHRSSTHRQGRPRKRERRAAKTRQQHVYRSHPNVEKTVRIQSETKNLQTQKAPLSYLGTREPGEPLSSNLRT